MAWRRTSVRCGTVLVFVVALVTPSGSASPAAAQTVELGVSDEQLLAAEPGVAIVEPHLAVNPADSAHFVVAAMVITEPDFSMIDCTIVSAFPDELVTRHDLGLEQCGDPWVVFNTAGEPLVSVLTNEGNIAIYRSPDGGRTWPSEPLMIDGAHDHPMMTVDGESGTIYVVSGQSQRSAAGRLRSYVSVGRSVDGGRSFRQMSTTSVSNMSYEAMTPVAVSDSRLFVPLQDHHRSDGERVRMRRAWLLESDDGGRTMSAPRLINEGCNRSGPVGWPSMAGVPTRSPANPGSYRLVWVCEQEGHDGIALFRSDDWGESWVGPTRVDEDRDGAWTKIPTIAVAPGGTVAVAWFDRSPGEECHAVRLAASTDAARTFGAPIAISSAQSCPVDSDAGGRFPAGGDYAGLVAIAHDAFLAVWSDARSGEFRLYQATVSLTPH